jgi:hypothetical protein
LAAGVGKITSTERSANADACVILPARQVRKTETRGQNRLRDRGKLADRDGDLAHPAAP